MTHIIYKAKRQTIDLGSFLRSISWLWQGRSREERKMAEPESAGRKVKGGGGASADWQQENANGPDADVSSQLCFCPWRR